MKFLFVLPVVVCLTSCSSGEEPAISLSPFQVSVEDQRNAYTVPTLDESLGDLRAAYGLAASSGGDEKNELVFSVFVEPQLFGGGYSLSGSVSLTEQLSSGSISLSYREHPSERITVALSQQQAGEVYSWFRDSGFLAPDAPEATPAAVLDGVLIWIEGRFEGRPFRFQRNAYESPIARLFYGRVDAFRIWSEKGPNKSPEPTGVSAPR